MAQKTTDHLRLGVFVIAGVVFLVIMLYMIGRKETLFGSNFVLKARFENVQGLTAGNNVRFAGIQVGTVRAVNILNDTTVEVEMRIEKKMRAHLKRNAVASIGTEGFIGNKVVNITASRETAPAVQAGDILAGKKAIDTEEMLRILESTNRDIAAAVSNLRITTGKINNSTALWDLLNDRSLPANLSASASNIRNATIQTRGFAVGLNEILADLRNGKGSLGSLLRDTSLAYELEEAIARIKSVGDGAAKLAADLNKTAAALDQELMNGKGTIHALLKDSVMTESLGASLRNIEQGTASFNQNMEALKHNILFRGYFRKLEKQQKQAGRQVNGTGQ